MEIAYPNIGGISLAFFDYVIGEISNVECLPMPT